MLLRQASEASELPDLFLASRVQGLPDSSNMSPMGTGSSVEEPCELALPLNFVQIATDNPVKTRWSVAIHTTFDDASVERAYLAMSEPLQVRALELRHLILSTAQTLDATGGIEETLKWGQPSYLPLKAKVGSAVRVAVHDDQHLGLYFNCNTTLVETFRSLFGDDLQYSKNRAVLFDIASPLPQEAIAQCVRMALYYHRDRHSS